MSVCAITFSREGMKLEFPDGTVELNAERAEIKMTRLKHQYEEAAAGGYDYAMSITADTVAEMRRAINQIVVYCWRRGLFAVQYAGMGKAAILEALKVRARARWAMRAACRKELRSQRKMR